jgi:DNA-binding SARP family transcriptional activator
MVSILRLSLLGSPAIEYDGKPVRLEMRKTFALLAYLSLSSQSSSRESLAAMFWPEFDQQHALTNLRRNVFSLGRALPPGLLEADRERIDLKKENWFELDVDQFLAQLSSVTEHSHPPGEICQDCVSSLEKAVNLYRGDFLEGFNLKDCPDFDEWQFFQRESLRSEYAGALKKLAEHYQEVRDWDKAIRVVRSWVALDRLNEQAHRVLITLYNQSGQRSKAFRQYESLVDLLQNDLGQDPEEETLLLYQNLLLNKNEEGIKDSQPLSKPTSRLSEPLIKTKLFIPPLRIDRVPRPQLVELLDAGAQRPLTLVSAPAGFGKTTLLTSWAAHTNLPVAWFSIDEGDNDPVRFMSYLITAVDSALMTNISGEFDGFTQSMQHSAQPALIQLINRLAAENEHFVLILDDYQFISSQEIHETLAYLLEKIPACMHLVIATRSDPPISLALLRARDQLTEIRMDVLRFNIEESGDFINKVMSLNISNEDITLLEGRTEGWIAGLQMAALAIRTATSHLDKEETSIIDGQAVSQFIRFSTIAPVISASFF